MGRLRHSGAEVGSPCGRLASTRWHCLPWWLSWRPAPAWASCCFLWKTRGEQVKPQSRTQQQKSDFSRTFPNRTWDVRACLEGEGSLWEGEHIYGPASHQEPPPTLFAGATGTDLSVFYIPTSQLFLKWHQDLLPTAFQMKLMPRCLFAQAQLKRGEPRAELQPPACTSPRGLVWTNCVFLVVSFFSGSPSSLNK